MTVTDYLLQVLFDYGRLRQERLMDYGKERTVRGEYRKAFEDILLVYCTSANHCFAQSSIWCDVMRIQSRVGTLHVLLSVTLGTSP